MHAAELPHSAGCGRRRRPASVTAGCAAKPMTNLTGSSKHCKYICTQCPHKDTDEAGRSVMNGMQPRASALALLGALCKTSPAAPLASHLRL
jgi:hypothetical protein